MTPPRRRARELLGRSLLVLAGSLAGLLALEGVVRLAQPQQNAYTGRGLYQPDFELGHALRPNLASGDISTNSFGFRAAEYPVAKPPGTFRIVGIGDSFTFGGGFPREIYLELLREKLQRSGFPVEVINTGVPAYSTIQEIGHLKKFGMQFQPDLVILGLFPTGDTVENRSNEHLEVVDGELTDRPVGRWERRFRRSHLYRWLRSRGVVRADAPAAPAAESYLAVEFTRLQVCRIHPRKYIEASYAITQRLLLELRDYLKAQGVRLVVLLIPDEVQVDPAVFKDALAAKGGEASDYDLDLPARVFREFCAREGIAVVDVLEACRQRNRLERVYRPQDTHWNEVGHEIAASQLYEHLTAHELRGSRRQPAGR